MALMAVASDKTSDAGGEGVPLAAGDGSGGSASGELQVGMLPGGPARKQNVACKSFPTRLANRS